MYVKIFEMRGFKIRAEYDGEAGLAAVKEAKPDIILLDIMMPRLNGLEVLDALKGDEATKSIPVVMLTNLSDQKQQKAALEAGAIKYLVKSDFDPDQTVEVVKEILKV